MQSSAIRCIKHIGFDVVALENLPLTPMNLLLEVSGICVGSLGDPFFINFHALTPFPCFDFLFDNFQELFNFPNSTQCFSGHS